jgi:hypothetical protein
MDRDPEVNMQASASPREAPRPAMSVKTAELQYKVAYLNGRMAGEAMSQANEAARQARDLWLRLNHLLTDAENDLHRALAAEVDRANA